MDKLGAKILADLLKQLTEQMGQKSTRRNNTLVRVGITIIQRDLSLYCQKQTTDHGSDRHRLASIQNS